MDYVKLQQSVFFYPVHKCQSVQRYQKRQANNAGYDYARIIAVKAVEGHMFYQYSRIRPDYHKAVGKVFVAYYGGARYERAQYKHDYHPKRFRKAETSPIHTHQKYCNISYESNRYPSEIQGKRHPQKYFLSPGEAVLFKLQGYKHKAGEKPADHYKRSPYYLIVPCEYPSDV